MMFTRLRNRILLVNLMTVSLIMLTAFGIIYAVTYRDVNANIGMELHRIKEFYSITPGVPGGGPNGVGKGATGGVSPDLMGERPGGGRFGDGTPPPERSVSFMLETDAAWNLIDSRSFFEMDDEWYSQALKEAAESGKDSGRFTLDGSRWIYSATPLNGGYRIVFLDISSTTAIMTTLVYTGAAVGAAVLVSLYFASRFFANRSIRPVQEAFEKQKQFIADASHELKTPLTIIGTNADVLLANKEDTIANQAKWLHYIASETERMTRLTNDLLYLTEMEGMREGMVYAPFNLSEAVESVMLTMEAVLFEHDLTLNYDIEPGITVSGSAEQLKQVTMILLDNAVKYAGADGCVMLSLKRQQGEVWLAVSNTGEGIPAEHLPRIFDRFYRADASRARKQGGYGLGLAIAKSIIDAHKGRIWAKSIPGDTTTFQVALPAGTRV